jgi:membrane protease YdiL (CAAX protease family)
MTQVVNGLFVGMLFASLALWTQFLRGRLPTLSAVRQCEPQTVARWSLFDLIVVLVFVFFPQMLAQGWALRELPIEAFEAFESPRPAEIAAQTGDASGTRPPARDKSPELTLAQRAPGAFVSLLWLRSAALLAGTGLGIAWVWSRHRDPLALGGDWSRWRSDVWLGMVGFLMVAPPVLLMQFALTQFFPSKHPLIELVLAKPEARFLWASGVAAVLVAPLTEEFQFRVLIQGWLQTAARPGMPSESWLVGLATPEWERQSAGPPRHWPAIATAALFALAHANHGPDPIPLFFFAWGIGWLYRGTSRVLPGVVVHFLLNLWTLFLLLVKIYGSSLT